MCVYWLIGSGRSMPDLFLKKGFYLYLFRVNFISGDLYWRTYRVKVQCTGDLIYFLAIMVCSYNNHFYRTLILGG